MEAAAHSDYPCFPEGCTAKSNKNTATSGGVCDPNDPAPCAGRENAPERVNE
jgi:hypothetical protein